MHIAVEYLRMRSSAAAPGEGGRPPHKAVFLLRIPDMSMEILHES